MNAILFSLMMLTTQWMRPDTTQGCSFLRRRSACSVFGWMRAESYPLPEKELSCFGWVRRWTMILAN